MNFLDQYNKNGYLIIENAYTDDEVKSIKNIVNNLKLDQYEHSKDKSGYPFRITNILPKQDQLKKIVEKKNVLSILQECMEDKVTMSNRNSKKSREYPDLGSGGGGCKYISRIILFHLGLTTFRFHCRKPQTRRFHAVRFLNVSMTFRTNYFLTLETPDSST